MKTGVVTATPKSLERALRLARHGYVLLCFSWLAGCAAVQPARQMAPGVTGANPVAVYVVRRKWHIDVGFAVTDLDPSLMPLRGQFRAAKYVFFGFGDRRYLLTRNKNAPLLLRALWPGPALILVTAIDNSPALAFGQSHLLRFEVGSVQARSIQAFIRGSISDAALAPLAAGPYEDSAYYAAAQQYSALYTCNTWAAHALLAGDQPVHARGVVFAGQLWRQAARLEQPATSAETP